MSVVQEPPTKTDRRWRTDYGCHFAEGVKHSGTLLGPEKSAKTRRGPRKVMCTSRPQCHDTTPRQYL
jgi:hypothetical protein